MRGRPELGRLRRQVAKSASMNGSSVVPGLPKIVLDRLALENFEQDVRAASRIEPLLLLPIVPFAYHFV
jgi:hypothetical protein